MRYLLSENDDGLWIVHTCDEQTILILFARRNKQHLQVENVSKQKRYFKSFAEILFCFFFSKVQLQTSFLNILIWKRP